MHSQAVMYFLFIELVWSIVCDFCALKYSHDTSLEIELIYYQIWKVCLVKICTFVFASVGAWSRMKYIHETILRHRSNYCVQALCVYCSRKPWKWQSLRVLHCKLKLIFIHDAYDKLYVYRYMCMYSTREVIDCHAIVIMLKQFVICNIILTVIKAGIYTGRLVQIIPLLRSTKFFSWLWLIQFDSEQCTSSELRWSGLELSTSAWWTMAFPPVILLLVFS